MEGEARVHYTEWASSPKTQTSKGDYIIELRYYSWVRMREMRWKAANELIGLLPQEARVPYVLELHVTSSVGGCCTYVC